MKYLTGLLLSLLLAACASTPHDAPPSSAQMNEVALYALSLADTPYRYGGNSRENGFDCSGFVQFVYLNTLGLRLPRTSAEMSRIGSHLDRNRLLPGDLVFFNTSRLAFSHVGIYVGDGRFVHSPSAGKRIHVASLSDSYWQQRYDGARRVSVSN
ncbi:MAG: C40 family peptidase [Gallionella sp.]|nr:C40 family peptidase [Gallionella sp.]